jgi:hypothetical protein
MRTRCWVKRPHKAISLCLICCGVEAGLMAMLTRMQTGKFKVFKHLNDWWEEFRLYHRKDGLVVKEGDDLMCATRYALMMLRFASTEKSYRDFRRSLNYPKAAVY